MKHILEYPRSYRFPLNRNVDQFIFIFLRILFHPHCYMKLALFRLENYLNCQDFFFEINGISSKTLSLMPWISQTFRVKSLTQCVLESRWQIHWTTIVSLIRENLANENNKFRARLHETRSELKLVWNLKPLWKVVPFTWWFHWWLLINDCYFDSFQLMQA